MAFERRLTLPDAESDAVERLGLTQDERKGYITVVGGEDVGYLPEMDHRLLSYPYALEPGAFTDAYMAAHGIEPPPLGLTEEQQEERQRAIAHLQELAQQWRPPAQGYTRPEDVIEAMSDLASRVDMGDLMRTVDELQPKRTPAALEAQRRRKELERLADEEWRLLLQVYSNDEAAMDWAGGGVIHFGVTREALAARDFSRVWVSLQFL